MPLFVVGVGTTAGGVIPEPKRATGRGRCRRHSIAASLAVIATAGGGRYFELDRDSDRDIANAIIDATRRARRRAATSTRHARALLVGAVARRRGFLGLGVLFLRDRARSALQLGGRRRVVWRVLTAVRLNLASDSK